MSIFREPSQMSLRTFMSHQRNKTEQFHKVIRLSALYINDRKEVKDNKFGLMEA
jgi:hypothetical protein